MVHSNKKISLQWSYVNYNNKKSKKKDRKKEQKNKKQI